LTELLFSNKINYTLVLGFSINFIGKNEGRDLENHIQKTQLQLFFQGDKQSWGRVNA
jgi:hypothetical protein